MISTCTPAHPTRQQVARAAAVRAKGGLGGGTCLVQAVVQRDAIKLGEHGVEEHDKL